MTMGGKMADWKKPTLVVTKASFRTHQASSPEVSMISAMEFRSLDTVASSSWWVSCYGEGIQPPVEQKAIVGSDPAEGTINCGRMSPLFYASFSDPLISLGFPVDAHDIVQFHCKQERIPISEIKPVVPPIPQGSKETPPVSTHYVINVQRPLARQLASVILGLCTLHFASDLSAGEGEESKEKGGRSDSPKRDAATVFKDVIANMVDSLPIHLQVLYDWLKQE